MDKIDSHILEFPMAEVGEAGYNEKGNALINGQGNEPEDWGTFSETGQTVAVKLSDGRYEHLIVNNWNKWEEWIP